jgi:regulatory protein
MDNLYYEKLVNAALRFVSYRPRSEKELTDFLTKKLTRWKVSGDVLIKKVVERMRELGYVDDKKFVEWWISQRNEFRPIGKRKLRFELQRKGIPQDDINMPFSEVEGAQKAIQKKLILWSRMPIIEQKKKAYTFLTQRGFSFDTIEKIIDEHMKKE